MEEKNITTPGGKAIVLKSMITARERNEVRRVSVGADLDEGQKNAEVMEAVEKKLITVAVLSYDGSRENVFERLLDSDPAEYDFAVAEAMKVVTPNLMKAE